MSRTTSYKMISLSTGDIREKNRWDIVINYCKTLHMDFSIFLDIYENFCHLHNIRKHLEREVIISLGNIL